ncbi:bombesin receptor subtype-3-like [Dendronephthya gigantea]|uniref:bombesin receptor subtype-3-like n=1 Tax=Dendronephthya gigantea TaxID=151771 RepID=UPI00106B13DA|nr:bombesin receptor subtype-3-like [Dendronephthya gigantea]
MANFELRSWELVCYSLIFIIGVLGNATVILVIRNSGQSEKHRFRDVPFNVYLMALAIVDMSLSIVCLPVYIMSTSAFPHPTGIGGDVFCKLVTGNVPQFWLAGVSIYLLVVISFERYAAISKPFTTRLGKTRKTYVYIALAWFFGFARELPVIVGIRYTATNATVGTSCYYWPKQLPNIFIFSILFISQYLAPAVIFLINFHRIKKRINRLDKTLKTALGDARQRVKIMKSKARSIRIVLMVLITFLICWTPNNIMYLLFQYGNVSDVEWSSDYYQFGIILGFSSSCINPFLYAFQSKQFRIHCGKLFRKIFKIGKKGQPLDASQSFTTSTAQGTKLSTTNLPRR